MKSTIAVVAVLLLVLAGCAKAPENKVASVSGDGKTSSSAQPEKKGDGKIDEKQMLEFAKCMREHGVDMPDPESKEGGVAIRVEGQVDEEKMKAADEACKKFLPNGGEMRKPSPEELDKMRQQAKCMRDKGYDMPDPDAEKPGAIQLPFDDSEKTQKDMKECGFEGMVTSRG